eukprot:TRINITY_DN96380_c0_g1_i1.p1 TRINITY_DN96380_c0_g1~~TRINITY_DN96380_c0_g1_i1.p1  ORF type:complete len:109 (-),score=0.17 TRINITY_DN96380_c0_g1_i1:16-342(-)
MGRLSAVRPIEWIGDSLLYGGKSEEQTLGHVYCQVDGRLPAANRDRVPRLTQAISNRSLKRRSRPKRNTKSASRRTSAFQRYSAKSCAIQFRSAAVSLILPLKGLSGA